MPNNLPLISVLIPSYNHERYIEETINSLIAQTYENIELIILDDGSKDNSWSIIQQLRPICEERFANIVFEQQKNQGVNKTLNKIASLARGEYLYFIASDDVAKPQAIEKLYNAMHDGAENYSLVVGDNEIIDAESQRIGWDKQRNSVAYEDGYRTFAEFLQDRSSFNDFNSSEFGSYSSLLKGNCVPNGFFTKREYFIEIGGYDNEALLEDWYMNLQLAKIGKFKFINEVLLSYRWHGANTIAQKKKIEEYKKRTFICEREKVLSSGNEELIKIFLSSSIKTRVYFNLFGTISLYSKKDVVDKEIILSFFGKKIIIKRKKIIFR